MSKPESGILNAMNKSFLRENIALIFAVLLALIFSREIYHHFGWVLGSFVLVFSMLFCFSKYKKYNVDLKISEKYVIISDPPEIKSINDDVVSGLDSKEIGRSPYQSARGISSRRLDRFIDVKNKPECEREKIENNFIFVFLSRVQ
ncbi:hypothetical protein [Serratia sp. DD3]|uniref:hypothetical protein n=1 Tax=Serratia sp. DD3 TaxID=1410619 RepID=UPI0004D4DAE5|nr:hypothetical protein [Serratia sp. DD3]KEY60417.1 hypothetical protein SRDD_05750 [Serratia sp. DD3]